MWQLPPLEVDEVIMYLRKSRTDDPTLDVAEVLSKHEQMLDEWVERNLPGKGRIPESNRLREVVSGETIEDRPKVQEALRRAESPKVKAVLIVEPQRLSRGDLEDIGKLVKLLRYSNTLVITLPYTYDLRDERDRDSFERELKRGNEFLEYQKRIMNNGRLLSVQNGNFVGNTAPYGYRKVVIREGKKKCHTLEPHPDEAPFLQLIFEMYAEGFGTTRICDKLDSLGAPGPRGTRWISPTVLRMLKNEHYLGRVVWNKRKTVRSVRDGEVFETRPVAEDYLVYEGKHPALITQELWDAVQERIGKNPPNKKATNFQNVLAGLLFCKACGRVMTRRTYTRPDGSEKSEPRYACTEQRHCGSGSATVEEVLEQVVGALREAIADFEVRIEQGTDDSVIIHQQMIVRLEKRLHELRELEVAQWDEKMRGQIPPHVFERLNAKTLLEIEELQQALCEARGSIPEPIDLESKLTTFHAALASMLDPDAPARETNALLKACIERIEFDREKKEGHARWGTAAPLGLHITLRA